MAQVRDVVIFVLGFVTRSMISVVSDLTYRWRYERATRWRSDMPKTSRLWRVRLYGITWDRGNGEYDVSKLPKDLEFKVAADDRSMAFEFALDDATDTYGSLISSVARHQIAEIK